jgi:hypothetical protein
MGNQERVMMARNAKLTASNRMLSVALLILAVTGAVGMFQVGERLADIQGRMHPTPAEEQRRLKRQLQVDANVEEELGRLSDDLGADRATVYLAHNGSTDLTGRIPFMFLSAVYVHLRPGIAWSEQWSRPTPLSVYSPTLRKVFADPNKPACVNRDLRDADLTPRARAQMEERGTERWIVCSVHGVSGVAGMVLTEFMRRDAVRDTGLAAKRTEDAAATVHRLLTAP